MPALSWSSPRTHDTHSYCRAISSGVVTTCFYELGLSRLGRGPIVRKNMCYCKFMMDRQVMQKVLQKLEKTRNLNDAEGYIKSRSESLLCAHDKQTIVSHIYHVIILS